MKLTESRLRSIIRSVIAEEHGHDEDLRASLEDAGLGERRYMYDEYGDQIGYIDVNGKFVEDSMPPLDPRSRSDREQSAAAAAARDEDLGGF